MPIKPQVMMMGEGVFDSILYTQQLSEVRTMYDVSRGYAIPQVMKGYMDTLPHNREPKWEKKKMLNCLLNGWTPSLFTTFWKSLFQNIMDVGIW